MASRGSRIRWINALLAAALVIFFFAHAIMGAAAQVGCKAEAPVALIWTFAALGITHAVACVATSFFMLTDHERPPSKKKRNHLWLKWGTGAFLLAAAALHSLGLLSAEGIAAKTSQLVVLVALAWHSFVGCKSIVRDLNMPHGVRNAMRAVIMVLTAGSALMIALG